MYQRKNRITKGIVKLKQRRDPIGEWNWRDQYWAECEHGRKSAEMRHKSYIIDRMSRLWLWCSKCEFIRSVNLKLKS